MVETTSRWFDHYVDRFIDSSWSMDAGDALCIQLSLLSIHSVYILLLVYMLRDIELAHKTEKITKIVVVTSVIVFILFLPAICGFWTTQDYLDGFLSWLPSWNLN